MKKEYIVHDHIVQTITEQIRNWQKGDQKKKLRFKHGSTNTTRSQQQNFEYIDTTSLNHVLEINTEEKWALVEPNVPMDFLVEETLKYGLVPAVVMEFPGITVGGGVQGAALESSSFKFGQFNDTCVEYELITGDGRVIKASENQNSDLFYGISSSYGTLAIVTLVKLRLIVAKPYVKLSYRFFNDEKSTVDCLREESKRETNDYLEGIIFSPKSAVVIKGIFSETAEGDIKTFNHQTDPWFYRHVKKILENGKEYSDYVPIKEYLFRYNRGAFWMGEYALAIFHIPSTALNRIIFDRFLNTRKLYERLHVANVSQNYLIQDFYYPFDKAMEYLDFNSREMEIYPVWLCPIKATGTAQKLSPHYSTKDTHLLNIGIYGQSKKFLKRGVVERNRQVEIFAEKNNARKMFYAQSYYPKDEFWKIYDYSWYLDLRKKYGALNVFPEIWEKIFVSELYKPKVVTGLLGHALKGAMKKIRIV
ncbi:MAG: FAD-binding protein [Candidatus Pacebacteria bacterium]|nr:FAD-binding protein [Candidatus Paceibacterota bacterium]MDD5356751.1 FAD-binding protein [Candidatus Paceibacterota bacterium]